MYDYFAEFLVEWLTVKGMQSSGQYGKIWIDVERVFKDMLKYITKDSSEIKLLCSEYGDDTSMSERVKNRGKELCKMLIRIIYWIGGLIEKWDAEKDFHWGKRDDIKTEEWKVEAYLRCILGKILIAKMFANHCDMEGVAGIVEQAVGETLEWRGIKAEHEECSGIDFGSIRIGHEFLWERMDEWLRESGNEKNDLEKIKKNGEACEEGSSSRRRSKDTGEEQKNTMKLLGKGGPKEWQELMRRRDQFPKGNLQGILEAVSSKGKDEVKSTVAQKIQELESKEQKEQVSKASEARSDPDRDQPVSAAGPRATPQAPVGPSKQGDEDCMAKDKLCQRTNCVATNWFKERIFPDGTGKQTWCTFWGWDVTKELERLSVDITNSNRDADNLCEKIDGKDTTLSEAQKAACNLIVRGLKHIYSIEVDLKNTKGKNEQEIRKRKNNRLLYQTMSCLFLNAYADRLKEKNPICITEEIISKAFSKGNGRSDTWCKEYPCAECKRDENYGACKLNTDTSLWNTSNCDEDRNKIRGKLDDMLKENQKIMSTLSTINNNLCERAKCVTVKWFENRIGGEGTGQIKQDWCTFWDTDVKNRLGKLSSAMSSVSAGVDNLCKDIGEKDGTSPGAKKQACELIVRGLERIYKIAKGTVDSNLKGDAKEKKEREVADNLIFHRTFSCILLNAYADMLEKLSCVGEDVINEAFEKSEQIKNGTDPCKSDPNCVTCTRDKSYETCTVDADKKLWKEKNNCQNDKGNVRNKVEGLFKNNDANIKGAVEAINNICPKPSSAPRPQAAKPAAPAPEGRRDNSGGEDLPPGKPPPPDNPQQGVPPASPPGKNSNTGKPGKSTHSPESACPKGDGLPSCDDDSIYPTLRSEDEEEDEYQRIYGGASRVSVVTIPTATTTDPELIDPTGDPRSGSPGGKTRPAPDQATVTQGPEQGATWKSDADIQGAKDVNLPKPDDKGSDPRVPGPGPVADPSSTGIQQTQPPSGAGVPGAVSPAASGDDSGRITAGAIPITADTIITIIITWKCFENRKRWYSNKKGIDPSDLLTPYLPTIPVLIGTSVISYLLWKYFFLGKRRKRYKRAHQVRGPSSSEEQLLDHVDDQADGPHEYTLVKERHPPRSAPTGRTKRSKKRGVGPRGVGCRTIIDIHLEVLDECQKGDMALTKEDYFTILVQEFMGSELMKEEPVHKEEVPSSDSGFKEKDFVPKEDFPKE
ncbi:SICA antigen [Plasmodium coatneyi]|uniref:SICA antigen n=1 Tax=Plasmodium coatneyi TaxID=208452 RepID=A0A1B1DZW6_9APIC|nr:SICA antigen [Plasmodium coatneyi]ANQ08322.1 SICA antigen [Plasmodium coatneyi]